MMEMSKIVVYVSSAQSIERQEAYLNICLLTILS